MKLILTPTPELQIVDGVECRVWVGHEVATEAAVQAYIRVVQPQTHAEHVHRYFEKSLKALGDPIVRGVALRFDT